MTHPTTPSSIALVSGLEAACEDAQRLTGNATAAARSVLATAGA